MLSDYDNVVTRVAQSPNSGQRSKFTSEVISDISDRTQLIVRHTNWRIYYQLIVSLLNSKMRVRTRVGLMRDKRGNTCV